MAHDTRSVIIDCFMAAIRDGSFEIKGERRRENQTSWRTTCWAKVDGVEMAPKNDNIGALCANKPLIAQEEDEGSWFSWR